MQALWLVRYGAYPITMALAMVGVALAPTTGFPLLALAGIAACGWSAVAVLERLAPFEPKWQHRDKDFPADVVHLLVNLAVMHAAVLGFVVLRRHMGWDGIWWPGDWPYLAQVFLAGLPLDLSLYVVHRLSHRFGFLWRLHSIHHSSRRLYWLNGERRHPLHAALMAGPGLLVLGLLGAPAGVVAGWFSLLAVHLAFQHANLEYRVGPLRYRRPATTCSSTVSPALHRVSTSVDALSPDAAALRNQRIASSAATAVKDTQTASFTCAVTRPACAA